MVTYFSLAASIAAVIVALYAAARAVEAHREKLSDDAVVSLYGQFEMLSDLRLQHWEASHLFEVASNYETTFKAVHRAIGTLDPDGKARMYLKEVAVALRIFSFFEQVLYQRESAAHHRAKRRARFLQEVLDYFTSYWLPNPRLLYLWENGLSDRYEPGTVDYFRSHVLESPQAQTLIRDAKGPYG